MTSGTLSVRVNELMGSYFMCGKGVWQGDPLSSLLFNIAMDTLAKINLAQSNQTITGLLPEYVDKGVAILQYADDTILCLEDNEENARNMKLLLYLFGNMSGLKINFNKSEVIKVSGEDVKSKTYSDLFNNCNKGAWPIKYLGVLVSGCNTRLKKNSFPAGPSLPLFPPLSC
jgi:hypothetical protein